VLAFFAPVFACWFDGAKQKKDFGDDDGYLGLSVSGGGCGIPLVFTSSWHSVWELKHLLDRVLLLQAPYFFWLAEARETVYIRNGNGRYYYSLL
jgi:hypothetical protein